MSSEEMMKTRVHIQDTLEKETSEGYTPRLVTFQKALGCRACLNKDARFYRVVFVGARLEKEKTYLHCFATLCDECLSRDETHRKISDMMLSVHENQN